MLECLLITKSRIRQDLLTVFFTNPSQRHYLRELQRLLGYSAGSIRRELLKFQKDDLFTTAKVGNLLFYSVNTRHLLFKELRSIIAKTIGVEGSLIRAFSRMPGVTTAFMPGPSAPGQDASGAVIHLVIIGDPHKATLNEKIAELEKRLKRKIAADVYSPREYHSLKRSRHGPLVDALNGPKVMLAGGEDDL